MAYSLTQAWQALYLGVYYLGRFFACVQDWFLCRIGWQALYLDAQYLGLFWMGTGLVGRLCSLVITTVDVFCYAGLAGRLFTLVLSSWDVSVWVQDWMAGLVG